MRVREKPNLALSRLSHAPQMKITVPVFRDAKIAANMDFGKKKKEQPSDVV